MRRVNLLPPEERRRGPERLREGALGVLLVAGAVALAAMVVVYLVFLLRLNALEDEIASLDGRIAEQNQRLAELSPYQDLRAQLERKKPVADGIFRTRFAWDEFLRGLAFVIPETTALETMVAQASPVDVDAPSDQPLSPPGSVTFTGIALPQYQNVADFVVRMNNLRFLANTQLESAELDRETYVQDAVLFEVAAELITEAGEQGEEVRLDGSADQAAEDDTISPAQGQYAGDAGEGI